MNVLNNGGLGYAALDFNQSGGYIPPDTAGAAGPNVYVETVNQTVALYNPKDTGASQLTDSFADFFFNVGRLQPASGGAILSDPIVVYDEQIGRFIVGDQNVDFSGTNISTFDIAVSKTNNPTTLTAADWNFYSINTSEPLYDADYPGNFGYNHDAFVLTLNMFGPRTHVQVVSVDVTDLVNGVSNADLHSYSNDVAGQFSLRPTTMHDSRAGDPMWLVGEGGDDASIDVIKMNGVLSNTASFRTTTLTVMPYSTAVPALNPDGSPIVFNIDSRIIKAAEQNNMLVACHAVSASPTQDVAQWYEIDVSRGTPVLAQQGRVSAGDNTYITYPAIDINSAGVIGMTYMQSGTDSPTDYMSMWVTGHPVLACPGYMEPGTIVVNGTGKANYTDFGFREGDLSGINVDPVDHTTFWAASEFANTEPIANWGTAVANFEVLPDAIFTFTTEPTQATAGQQFALTLTVTHLDGTPFPDFRDTVHLTSTDPMGLLPRDYKFTATDAGAHTFFIRLRTAGSQTITASDITDCSNGGVSDPILVVPAPTSKFLITSQGNLPPGDPYSVNVQAGVPFTITVAALDPFNNPTPGYQGTVHFSSSDSKAVLPPNFTFTAANRGVAVFQVTLSKQFQQSITVKDVVNTTAKGSISINVVAGQEARFIVQLPSLTAAGVPVNMTISAVDQYGNVLSDFDDGVTFTSTDGRAILPMTYWFTPGDHGKHIFVGGVTFGTIGFQTVTATEVINPFGDPPPPSPITGKDTVKVSGTAPPPPPSGTGGTTPTTGGTTGIPLVQLAPYSPTPTGPAPLSLTPSNSLTPATSFSTSGPAELTSGSGGGLSGDVVGDGGTGSAGLTAALLTSPTSVLGEFAGAGQVDAVFAAYSQGLFDGTAWTVSTDLK